MCRRSRFKLLASVNFHLCKEIFILNSIIDWCNENTGFLSAILSIVGILLSFIAICISIHTARLPYKKSLKLSSFYDVLFSKSISNMVSSQTIGLSINAVNT